MKKIFYLSLIFPFFNPTTSYSEEKKFNVLIRKENSYKTLIEERTLPDLTSHEAFEGRYFKIVLNKSNEPILFSDENKDLRLKAATVYYHLMEGRKFWTKLTPKEKEEAQEKNQEKITVRLEIKNQFDQFGHFAHDNLNPQFNNALSVPGGESPPWVPVGRRTKWNKEIWFRPMKKIKTKELGYLGKNPLVIALESVERPLRTRINNQILNRILLELLNKANWRNPLYKDLIRYTGTYALMKLILYGAKLTDPLFIDDYYYLDTALVPEIIYHEYAHLMLSDRLEMTHSTAVNEGMADYFAAVQSKLKRVYEKVPGRNNANSKNTRNKKKYSHWDESNGNAISDFTLSVLFDVRRVLGEEVANQVILEARNFLETRSATINKELLHALIKACEKKCKLPQRDKLILYEAMAERGF